MKLQHTRTKGLGLTYDIEVDGPKYVIHQAGKQLCNRLVPAGARGGSLESRAVEYAISDIEGLVGIDEA